MSWMGPFTISEMLDDFPRPEDRNPPEEASVYLVSQKAWVGNPTCDCVPLYVGGITGKSSRFRTRIGDLMADLFGFFGGFGGEGEELPEGNPKTGHHSGGIRLYYYCKEKGLKPQALYIAWQRDCECGRCAENGLYDQFQGCGTLLNKKRPPVCGKHHSL